MDPAYAVRLRQFEPFVRYCGYLRQQVTDVCVQEPVQLSYPSQGGAGTCGVSVSARYQYPYHFSIPLTNLDIGNVLLPGQAQMRVETQ